MAQALLGGYHAVPGCVSSLVFNGIACLISTPAQWWEMAGWHSEASCITSPGQSRAEQGSAGSGNTPTAAQGRAEKAQAHHQPQRSQHLPGVLAVSDC